MFPTSFAPNAVGDARCCVDMHGRAETLTVWVGISESEPMLRAGFVAAAAYLEIKTALLLGEGVPVCTPSKPASLYAVEDHINLLGDSPLIGSHDPTLGPRFPDMTQAYSPELLCVARSYVDFPGCVYAGHAAGDMNLTDKKEKLAAMGAHFAGPWFVPELIAVNRVYTKVVAFVRPVRAHYGQRVGAPLDDNDVFSAFKEIVTRIISHPGARGHGVSVRSNS